MKFKSFTTTIGLAAIVWVQLAATRPSLSQTDLDGQLLQALCAQNWGQALQVIDQMKRAAGPEYASQLNLYRGNVEVLARENVNLSKLMEGCPGGPPPSDSASTDNPIPPTPSSDIPSSPGSIPSLPGDALPPPPPL